MGKFFKGFGQDTKEKHYTSELRLRHLSTGEEQDIGHYTFAVNVPTNSAYYKNRPLPDTHRVFLRPGQCWGMRHEADHLATQHLHVEVYSRRDRLSSVNLDPEQYAVEAWLYRGNYQHWREKMPDPIFKISTVSLVNEGGAMLCMSESGDEAMTDEEIEQAKAIAVSTIFMEV